MQALGLRPGGPLPASKGDAEERINQIDRVAGSRLEAVCCFDDKTVLYVGIEERDAPHYDTRPAPGGSAVLPEEVLDAYRQFQEASRNGPARELQERFPALTAAHLDALRAVLRESFDELHRAAAAYLLAYAPNKAPIVTDLEYGLTDSDSNVRATAVRSLTALAVLGRQDPASRIRVSTVSFVEMLNSLAWTDRMEASRALDLLTKERDSFTLARIRARALDAIVEMARWKTPEHAQPAFRLVGRVAGLSEAEIEAAWASSDRERVIGAATGRKNR
jgi:hypothetical protein